MLLGIVAIIVNLIVLTGFIKIGKDVYCFSIFKNLDLIIYGEIATYIKLLTLIKYKQFNTIADL